jgi:hypothetical protein
VGWHFFLPQAVLQVVTSERRVLCATLHVDAANTAALGLYTKAGFQQVREAWAGAWACLSLRAFQSRCSVWLQCVTQPMVAQMQAVCLWCRVTADAADCMLLLLLQDGVIQDYYGQGRPALKLLVDLQESPAMQGFLSGCSVDLDV